ncbi:hypothetical protein [Salinispora fenicalii]|uniref:hypothetical protein n=1 Tax=Salinispora fenicalii TaxID=1137263 RepID=UPI0004876EA4|nr:hypothetical protein [Salinispora fenicalii]
MGLPDEDFAPGEHLTPDERNPEAEPADALEQATVVLPGEVEVEPQLGLEVNGWDATEQARAVGGDEDDYR